MWPRDLYDDPKKENEEKKVKFIIISARNIQKCEPKNNPKDKQLYHPYWDGIAVENNPKN